MVQTVKLLGVGLLRPVCTIVHFCEYFEMQSIDWYKDRADIEIHEVSVWTMTPTYFAIQIIQ